VTRYVIAADRSQVWIDARSNVHPIHSSTDGLTGFVELELKDGKVDLSVMPTGTVSLSVDRLSSGNRMEDREMLKRIDARRYPSIDGKLETMTADEGDDQFRVSGNITFRGISQPHEDVMHIRSIDERTIQLDGSSRFDIRTFGMEPPRILMFKVEPEVDIRVEILAVEEGKEG
jgi:polyisoprenoid-binding protein YceI